MSDTPMDIVWKEITNRARKHFSVQPRDVHYYAVDSKIPSIRITVSNYNGFDGFRYGAKINDAIESLMNIQQLIEAFSPDNVSDMHIESSITTGYYDDRNIEHEIRFIYKLADNELEQLNAVKNKSDENKKIIAKQAKLKKEEGERKLYEKLKKKFEKA